MHRIIIDNNITNQVYPARKRNQLLYIHYLFFVVTVPLQLLVTAIFYKSQQRNRYSVTFLALENKG